MRHLILGGARSGKTRLALKCALEWSNEASLPVTYVATAQALDQEMRERITRHRLERPAAWRTVETPLALAPALASIPCSSVILIDCLTLWLSNALLVDFDEAQPRAPSTTWQRERATMVEFLEKFSGRIILVSNEVGCGIVPMSALARRFQDEQGWLNQDIAALCERVTLVAAGLPLQLKGDS